MVFPARSAAFRAASSSFSYSMENPLNLLGYLAEFQIMQMAIELALGEQLAVIAGRFNPALVEQQDPIARPNGGGTVREEDDGSAGQDPCEGIVEECFDVVVEGTVGFFDDQYGRIAENGPGQGDEELLAAVEDMPHFADRRLIAVGELLNELMSVGKLR